MIFFDIDDTLLDNQSAEREAAIEFHLSHSDIFPISSEDFALHWQTITEKHVRRYLSGELTFQGQRRERLKELFAQHHILTDSEADVLFEDYLAAYERNWKLFSDVEACLEQMVGITLGIISNGDSHQQRQKLNATGIVNRFSVIAISEEIGIAKPDQGIFHTACRMAGVSPSECWHIGDNFSADVEGSLSAGLHGVWLNRIGKNTDKGITTIESLSELKGIIDSHNHAFHQMNW